MRDHNPLLTTAQAFLSAGYNLIPIRPNQKLPVDKGWTTSDPYRNRDLKTLIEQGHNMGCRLTEHDLLVDVDAKHPMGIASYDQLKLDVPELADLPFNTKTVNNGFHFYLRWPESAPKPRGGLKAYPGIDFLSAGRQALIGGCTVDDNWYHPGPAAFPAQVCPPRLVELLTVGNGNGAAAPAAPAPGYGCIDEDTLADALMYLDAEEFAAHQDWLNLMMSCHWLTGGTGLHSFAEWSRTDILYADHDISGRWQSCGNKAGGRTYDLIQALKDRGFDAEMIEEPLRLARAQDTFKPIDAGPPAPSLDSFVDKAKTLTSLDQIVPLLADMLRSNMEAEIEVVYPIFKKPPFDMTRAAFKAIIKQIKERLNTADPDSIETRARQYIQHVGGAEAIRHVGKVVWSWEQDQGCYRQYSIDNLKGSVMKFLAERMIELVPMEVKGVVELVTGLVDEKDPVAFWDQTGSNNGQMFNMRNSELWITPTGIEVQPHNMAHRRRGTISVAYDSRAECPTWMKYLKSSFPASEYDITVRKLAIGIAYSCTESLPFLKKCWYLHGPTNTGKSRVVEDVLRQLTQPAFNAITMNQLSDNNFALADLEGMLANAQTEVPSKKFMESDTFKKLIGGDTINADRKNKGRATYAAQTVLWFNANDPINFGKAGSRGVLERIVYIHYGSAQKVLDFQLGAKLRRELPGIFRWAFDIYTEEYRRDQCKSVLEAMTENDEEETAVAQAEVSPHLQWFDTCLVFDTEEDTMATTAELCDNYQAWQMRHPSADPVRDTQAFANKFKSWIKDIPGCGVSAERRYFGGKQQRCWVGVKVTDASTTGDRWDDLSFLD